MESLKFTFSAKDTMKHFAAMICAAVILSLCSACSTPQKSAADDNKTNGDFADTLDETDKPASDENTDVLEAVVDDYSYQINEEGTGYELDGRVSNYPIVIGTHEHDECDNSDAELMALGQEKLDAAVKIDSVIIGTVPRDYEKELPVEGGDEGYFAISEDFGTYDNIIELYKKTFSPDTAQHLGYYSVTRPAELLDDGLIGLTIDGETVQAEDVLEVLKKSMIVDEGTTYETVPGLRDTRTVKTKVIGVLSHTDTHIEYRLCTMVFDEEGEILLEEQGIPYDRPQVRYEHTVMKLDLIDGEWLITQIRDELQQFVDFIDTYGYEF